MPGPPSNKNLTDYRSEPLSFRVADLAVLLVPQRIGLRARAAFVVDAADGVVFHVVHHDGRTHVVVGQAQADVAQLQTVDMAEVEPVGGAGAVAVEFGVFLLVFGDVAVDRLRLVYGSEEQQVRMVQYKQQLFINLTHGLKTPLTMMQVPLQLMADKREPLSGGDIAGLLRVVLPDYNVVRYDKVEEMLRAVRERRPQLVLIDIVVYDREAGLGLCRKLKGSKQTDDIPVVLLTADDTPEDAREFCEAGADSWMEKPFDVELFRARVRQLVSRHADLQRRLKIGQILGKCEEVAAQSVDEQFMSRVTEIIGKNIANEEFSLEIFAREMRVSRSVLNMRIQHLMGSTPMELLRIARMERAAQLLATNAYDVAQVGYMVGFTDPRYFSTCFKKQFGVSPRIYMLNNRGGR